jgi:hypothetical protein
MTRAAELNRIVFFKPQRVFFVVVLFASVAIIALFGGCTFDLSKLTPIIGGALGVWYFVQQQQLSGIELFHTLFKDFNARYDGMNDCLMELRGSTELTTAQIAQVHDFLNLCAEEYFFYRSGNIPDDVWASWCKGIQFHLSDPRIGEIWVEESKSGSHYGLSDKAIAYGAGLRR